MQSLFWATAGYGFIALWLAYRKKKNGMEGGYTGAYCLAGYLLGRAFVMLQLRHLGAIAVEAAVMDTGMAALFMWLAGKHRLGFRWEYVWLYVSNPVILLSLSSFRKTGTVTAALLLVLLVIKLGGIGRWERHSLELYRYYISFTVCAMIYLAARLLLGQSGSQCTAGDGSYPMLWILSVSLAAATTVSLLHRMTVWKKDSVMGKASEQESEAEPEQEASASQSLPVGDSFNGRDIVFLVLLTAVYAGLAFFRLGSTVAPQSYVKLSEDSDAGRQMIFRFGEEIELSKIEIFLGVESRRKISFSCYDFEAEKWEVFDSKREIVSVFTWNTVPVNRKTRMLAMVLMDEEAYIHEIVFLDRSGRQVLPVNWQDYAEAFDEQALYPQYTTYYEGTMFDEVYHARTAYEFVHRLPVYEITHPPLGKLLISIGIRLFGMTPFGWRLVCALLGTAMVPLMYLFARRIFRQRGLAVFSTGLFCLDFMHLTLSRIATLDIIVAFFVLGMFFFMYLAIAGLRQEGLTHRSGLCLLLCGLFSACAVSTKWTGFYALAGIAVLFLGYLLTEYVSSWQSLMENRRFLGRLCGICVISFVLIPAAVYFLSYIPYMWCGNPDSFIKITIDNFKLMLSYHERTVFAHSYSSEWYEWLWNKRPLLDALNAVADGKTVSVATFGNPVIWWGGLAALLHNIYLWRCRKEKVAAYLCIAYLSMLLPWMFIYRTVFIYQYFICSNILVLLLGNSFYHMGKYTKRAMLCFGLTAGVAFLFFYPVVAGYPVRIEYVNQGLEWLRSWGLG